VKTSTVALVSGLAAAWIAFCLLVWGYGESPRVVAALLVDGTWGTAYGAGQVLFKATPLLFTGIAVNVALRAGLFNIGAEGQLTIASLAVAAVATKLPQASPPLVAIPIAFAVAMIAGGAWTVVPAVLRVRFGAHEVISTIMMNRIADCLVSIAFALGLARAGTVRTADVAPGARLTRLDSIVSALHGSAASFALPIAIVVAFVVAAWLRRTRTGREVTLVGLNARACAAEHVPVSRRLAQALILSGAIAGLASFATVLGYKGYFESGLGAGAGFGGIAVALLARNSAVGLVLAALLFGTLAQGALSINAIVPMELTTILQGVVIAAVAAADARIRAVVVGSVTRGAR
jgi:general nucleoside transport system permease protein